MEAQQQRPIVTGLRGRERQSRATHWLPRARLEEPLSFAMDPIAEWCSMNQLGAVPHPLEVQRPGVPMSGEKLSRKASDYFSDPLSPKRGKQTPAVQVLRTAPELLLSIQQNDYDTATLSALVDFASALESSAANKLKFKKEQRSNSSDKRLQSEAAVDSPELCAPAGPEDE